MLGKVLWYLIKNFMFPTLLEYYYLWHFTDVKRFFLDDFQSIKIINFDIHCIEWVTNVCKMFSSTNILLCMIYYPLVTFLLFIFIYRSWNQTTSFLPNKLYELRCCKRSTHSLKFYIYSQSLIISCLLCKQKLGLLLELFLLKI